MSITNQNEDEIEGKKKGLVFFSSVGVYHLSSGRLDTAGPVGVGEDISHSDVEIEHDLFNSVINKEQEQRNRTEKTSPPHHEGQVRQPAKPSPQALAEPSNTEPTPEQEYPSDANHDSDHSVDTIKGGRRSPNRRSATEEEASMDIDDGELGDSESDDNEQETLDRQIVSGSL